jgi:hypothetical protein
MGKANNTKYPASASLIFDFDCSKNKTSIEMSLEALGIEIGKMSFVQNTKKAEKITMPEADEDDIEEWTSNFDPDAFMDVLEDAGFGDLIDGVTDQNSQKVMF